MKLRLYEGTNRVLATPMTRGAYNQYRGWETPADESPKDEGYLVNHEAPTQVIDSAHAFYFITWMPKDLFEQAFKMVSESTHPPHQQRVLDEKQDLDIHITKLDEFIERNPVFTQVPGDEQARLKRQLDVMHELSVILSERIANF